MREVIAMQRQLNDYLFVRNYKHLFKDYGKVNFNEVMLDLCRAVIHELEELYHATTDHQILIEIVDILHFLISMGILLDLEEKLEYIEDKGMDDIMSLVSMVVAVEDELNWKWWKKPHEINKENITAKFLDLWRGFWRFVNDLGFKWDEIKNYYLKKNELNFFRWRNDYGGSYRKYDEYGREDNDRIDEILSKE